MAITRFNPLSEMVAQIMTATKPNAMTIQTAMAMCTGTAASGA